MDEPGADRAMHFGKYDEGVELLVNKPSAEGMKITWQLPNVSFVGNVLRNPFYAGAFIWGQRPVKTTVVEGKLVKRQCNVRTPEECEVFIPEHHEGYIDWETFQENLSVIRNNNMRGESDEAVGAVRSGNGDPSPACNRSCCCTACSRRRQYNS